MINDIMKIFLKIAIFGLLIFILIQCISRNQKLIIAHLSDSKDSTLRKYQPITVFESNKIDLKFCLAKFKYPPKLPMNIFWIKPDTFSLSPIDKENLVFKYRFDSNGRVSMYFYQGSLISGVFPLLYAFKYDSKEPKAIIKIDDIYYHTSYRIKYDSLMNIKWIEKVDSIPKRKEILWIEYK